jgi:hypothetical protein
MPRSCVWTTLPDGTRALVQMDVPRCSFCKRAEGDRLCDFDIGDGKTCDARVCGRCAKRVGPNLDHCPNHAGVAA